MESILGLKEAELNHDENLKLVPWLNWQEWSFVYTSFFSSSHQSITKALQRIMAWRSRGCLPVVIEVTASIVEIQQNDPHFREELSVGGSNSEELLAMLYTMAIMRIVNCVIEKTRKQTGESIAEAAAKINMPRMLIDLRHEGSHRELPSLKMLRLASIKALDWLKSYYWDHQKNAIPYESGKSADVRKEIRTKLREMAFCLKVKQDTGSSSSGVKGNRIKHHEQLVGATIHGRNKLFSLVASKFQPSKYLGSKKQITRTLKNIARLYSFFSSDVVSVLMEFLLDASNSLDFVDSQEKIQTNLSLDAAQAVFDEWKPVINKVCKKEPELLLSLLKAVLDMIESRKTIRDDFGSELFNLSQYDSELQRIGVLSSLFMWLVQLLKGLKLAQQEGQESQVDSGGCLPKASLIELVRRCLHISDPGNCKLVDSAMMLAGLVKDSNLSDKLCKYSSMTKLCPRVAEDSVQDVNTNDLVLQDKYIRQAAMKLELVKRRRISKASSGDTQDETLEGANVWTIAKSWNPCPIGMLPRDIGSSGCLPVLDFEINGDTKEVSNIMNTKKHLKTSLNSKDTELRHCSEREPCFNHETMTDSTNKRMREMQNFHPIEPDNWTDIVTSDSLKGVLLIDGVWQKVGNHELQDIKSKIGILVKKRKT